MDVSGLIQTERGRQGGLSSLSPSSARNGDGFPKIEKGKGTAGEKTVHFL